VTKPPTELVAEQPWDRDRAAASPCVAGSAGGLDPASDLMIELLRDAHAAWPGVELAPQVFAGYLSSRLAADSVPALGVRELRTGDLYLACACARSDPKAIAAFERHVLGGLDATLRKLRGMTPDIIDEVKQRLRQRLLVADGRSPRILEYSGRGELRRWLRVIAVRQALAMRQRDGRETPSEGEVLERALPATQDLEKDFYKQRYQGEFTHAIGEALSALSVRHQVLLRQAFVDDLSIDELGRLYRVHRATAARWLAHAREALSNQTRAVLMRRLTVSASELNSILRWVRSGLELSLRVVFVRRRSQRWQ